VSPVPEEPLITVADFRRRARVALPRMAWDYFRSGADAQHTLKRNRAAFRRVELWYHVLRDVSVRELGTTVLGTPVSMPVLVAPTAYHKLAHPDGEVGTAQAAAEAGTVFICSTLATTRLEEVAAASTGPRWFQLYVHKDRGLTRSLCERAEAAGYRALVLTVDAPLLGRRLADERNRFALPHPLTMANLVTEGAPLDATGSMLAGYFAARHDPSLTWSDLAWLQKCTRLPIVVKGIVRADDAARAVGEGAAAVVVSNHGGRQLDGSPATLDALPRVADAVAGCAEVLMDGGVRWGTDVVKALALGARAVLVGRPIIWGLAVGGRAGVLQVLTLLREELSVAMALCGCASLSEIGRDLVGVP
jgi:4-hydroxymandelate oxidase